MPAIGPQVHELRINDRDSTWRIVYRIDKDAVVIAEVFARGDWGAMTVQRGEVRPMDAKKRKKLEASGWKVGDAKEFLGLSAEELDYIEIKLALGEKLRDIRERKSMTQAQTARLVGSSQSRLAKMEAGDPSVSVDLLIKTLISLGVSRNELAKVIGTDATAAA